MTTDVSTPVRFGKGPAKHDYRTLKLGKYVTTTLAPPPPRLDLLLPAEAEEAATVQALFPMDGNDTIGDCTIAGIAHATTLWRALSGQKPAVVPSQDDVEALYYQLTGGGDTGLYVLDVLNYWRKNAAFGDDKVVVFVSVDPKNHELVQQAMSLFGGLAVGFQVQEGCVEQFNAGEPWTPAPLTADGHFVWAVGYGAAGVNVLSWGKQQAGTWDWWDECVDEVYAIIAPETTTIDGIDLATLQADLDAVGGLPVPPPPTPQPPTPTPTPTPTPPQPNPLVVQARDLLNQVIDGG